jgi:hypothetical protein
LDSIAVVKPDTIVRWHGHGFRALWRWKSRRRLGRSGIAKDMRDLIREISRANPLWGAPRIHGELLKLGIDVAQSTVAKYTVYVGCDLADILCLHEDRVVGRDNCVAYKRLSLQIPPNRHRHHYVKAKVRVHEYSDGRLAVFHGPRCLARYHPDGRLVGENENAKTAA